MLQGFGQLFRWWNFLCFGPENIGMKKFWVSKLRLDVLIQFVLVIFVQMGWELKNFFKHFKPIPESNSKQNTVFP